jgi:hypothetical protein
MFYVPKAGAASWGANLPRSPVMVDSRHIDMPEPQTIFMVAASEWSDGTPFVRSQHQGH